MTNAPTQPDLRSMTEDERLVALAGVLEQIEKMLAFERMPWQAVLEKYIQ